VLYLDALVYAGHVHTMGAKAAYRGHLLVEPRRHVEGYGFLTEDEAGEIGRLVDRLSALLRERLGADHVYVWAYGGMPETAQTPRHLHLHVNPRYPGTPQAHWGPMITRWPDAPRVDEAAMRALVATLKDGL